jgi:alpha-1,2-mannosyltransferase
LGSLIFHRPTDFVGLLKQMLVWAILLVLWLAVFRQFADAMLPRWHMLIALPPWPDTPPCDSPNCDFSAFWPAGLLFRNGYGAQIYHLNFFAEVQHTLFPLEHASVVRWIYPPPTLLLGLIVSFLPYEPAFWIWTVCLILLALLILRLTGLSWSICFATLLSPASLWNMELGQLGTLMGACFVSGLLIRAPIHAGTVLGFLTFKPQYGLLLPFALSGGRRWVTLATVAAIALTLMAMTFFISGWPIWQAYFHTGTVIARQFLETSPNEDPSQHFGVSVFWMIRSFGGTVFASYLAQLASFIAAALATWLVWRNSRIPADVCITATVMLSLFATPYGYTDDMVAWSAVLAISAHKRRWQLGILDVLFWIWPMLCPIVAMDTGFELTPLIVLLGLARCAAEVRFRKTC